MNTKIIDIQDMLLKEMERLNDDTFMLENGTQEIYRSNAITNSAERYLKAVNLSLRIKETAKIMNKLYNL